ncbi:efflux RND transporter periplasmic adaptor subunit [Bordetella genomosp. 12]|nr:efflux RND transporter periplasmic adaptor subunit [Bordetella genomosp. 12]
MKNLLDLPFLRLSCLLLLALSLSACDKPSDSAPDAQTQASLLTVDIVQAREQAWPRKIQVNGAIQAWQEIIVSPETGGLRVSELLVDVGASVKRGDVLARLADETVVAEQRKQAATVAQAQAAYEQAQSDYRRARATEKSGALSAQKVEEYRNTERTAKATLQAAQADLDTVRIKLSQTRIVAADDGLVATKTGILGDVVASGTELYRLIRQGRLEWRAEVDAKQLAGISVNDAAQIDLPDGRTVAGRVRLIDPVLADGTARAVVYVDLDRNAGARRGMFATGFILSGDSQALTLPQSAITRRDGRAYVWLLRDDDHVISRAVTLGRQQGDQVEVISGLTPQDRVVRSGGAFLAEDAKVSVVSAQTAKASQ